jgi:hypothetical protein
MLKTLIVVSGIIMLLGTIALAVENRRSPQIYTFASAMVGGVALSLVFLYGAFRDAEVTNHVTASFIFDIASGRPAPLPFDELRSRLPDFRAMLDRLEQTQAFIAEFESSGQTIPPALGARSGTMESFEFYEDLLQIQAVTTLQPTFEVAWDFERRETSMLGELSSGRAGGVYPAVTLDRNSLLAHLSTNRFASLTVHPDDQPDLTSPGAYRQKQLRVLGPLTLPPKSSFEARRGSISIKNPFIRLTLSSAGFDFSQLTERHAPLLRTLGLAPTQPRPGLGGAALTFNINYIISGTKHGHPDIDVYRRWGQEVVGVLKQAFDDRDFWAQVAKLDSCR